jgi:hypothetical protein
MKGSAITGPVGKEAAELWPVSATTSSWRSSLCGTNMSLTAYRLQLWCCDVSGCLLRETVHSGGVRAAFYAQASSMISCHEGTSSQTIFSAETKNSSTLCMETEHDKHDAKTIPKLASRSRHSSYVALCVFSKESRGSATRTSSKALTMRGNPGTAGK